jgi:GT2 family glycosyltransferase
MKSGQLICSSMPKDENANDAGHCGDLPRKRVAVVVVAWNSGADLIKCVGELSHVDNDEGGALSMVVVVVDNGSSDGSIEELCGLELASVKIVRLPCNEGFARACNIGAMSVQCDYYLFLNPDARISPEAIDSMCDVLECEAFASIGIAGPRLINEGGDVSRSCSRFPTLGRLLFSVMKVPGFGRFGVQMSDWRHDSRAVVDQVIGAAFFVRAPLFEDLLGFDERFFVYYEEVDFCKRAKNLGVSCLYINDVSAFHSGGGSSGRISTKRLFYVWRSRLLYSRKHLSVFSTFVLCFSCITIEPLLRIFRSLLNRRGRESVDIVFVWSKLVCWLWHSKVGRVSDENRSRLS